MIEKETLGGNITHMELLQREMHWLDTHQYLHDAQFVELLEELSEELIDPIKNIDRIIPVLLNKITARFKGLVSDCFEQAIQFQQSIKQMHAKLQQKNDQISGLNDTIEILNTKILNWQREYEGLKAQVIEVQEQYERRLKDLKRQKKQIKQTFRMVQESTVFERQLFENLQVQKQQYHQQVQQQKKQKRQLLDQLIQVKLKLNESEKQLIRTSSKITWEEKRIRKLQETIEDKNKIIDKLMLQLKENTPFTKTISENSFVEPKLLDQSEFAYLPQKWESQDKKKSFVETFKLSDEIQSVHIDEIQSSRVLYQSFASDERYMKPFEENELNRSSVIDGGSEDMDNTQRGVKESQPGYPDLYFAHFILTAQTIKLKLNQQELFMIDIKPYYSQILRQRVTFHMWDVWITNKLKQVSALK